VQDDCSAGDLRDAARTSVALDRLVERHALGSLAYYHMGTGSPENEAAISSIILGTSLLTARHVPVAGEMEVKNVQAMKIMDAFGAGGSFTEYYAMDFKDDVVLMGHDGPGHIAIAEGKTKVRPLRVFHGKVGRGLSVEMSVRHGPVTLLSVVQTADGRLEFLTAQGESVPGADPGNRQHQQPVPVPHRRAGLRQRVERARAGPPLRGGRGPPGRPAGKAREPPRVGRDAGLLTAACRGHDTRWSFTIPAACMRA
jgi:L-arabinose isomerase